MNQRASLAWAGGIAGLAMLVALATPGRADRPASPAVTPALADDAMTQIGDVYAWMQTSQILNLVMDVSPGDDGSHSFGPGVSYVFHLTSKANPAAPGAPDVETRVICQFASNTSVQCWVTDPSSPASAPPYKAYLTGDPSQPAGIQTADHKLRMFAGRRSDPQFFNTAGFAAAVSHYKALAVGKQPDLALCPTWLTGAQADSLLADFTTGGDSFVAANVMAIVVQLDTSLVNASTNRTVSVWGASHAAP